MESKKGLFWYAGKGRKDVFDRAVRAINFELYLVIILGQIVS